MAGCLRNANPNRQAVDVVTSERNMHELGLPRAAVSLDFAAPALHQLAASVWRIPEIAASALLAQLVEHFHGKEGVDGSSPSEGSPACPA